MEQELSADEWCELFNSARMAAALSSHMKGARELAELHNAGRIDLFALVEKGELQALDGDAFFMASDVFGKILPLLDGTVERVMSVVEALVVRSGGNSNIPSVAFENWLAAHPDQAKPVIEQARAGVAPTFRHLSSALIVLADAHEARATARDFSDERQKGALIALSRMPDKEDGYKLSLELLEELVGSHPSDETLGQALHTAASILARGKSQVRRRAIKLIHGFAETPGPQVCSVAARVIWMIPGVSETGALPLLIDLVAAADPGHERTAHELDMVTVHLLEQNKLAEASGIVRRLLAHGHGRITLDNFQGFVHGLFARPAADVGQVVVDWLMNGDLNARGATVRLLGHSALEGMPVEFNAHVLPSSDADRIFLCRKAIGWLVLLPISATSLVLAVLRESGAEVREQVAPLLVGMLLKNYKCAREYAKNPSSKDKLWRHLRSWLKEASDYLDALGTVPRLRELDPGDDQRRIQYFRHTDQMRAATKAAQERSVLASIFKQSVVLHGAATLFMVRDPNGTMRPVEAPMGNISVEKEMPQLHSVDPVGFDMDLYVLMMEGC